MSDRVELPTVGGPGGEACGGCYFWGCGDDTQPLALPKMYGGNRDRFGWCYRFPPRFPSELRCFQMANEGGTTNGLDEIDDYPMTHTGMWCGEYRARAEK